jgi:hypothetical protein
MMPRSDERGLWSPLKAFIAARAGGVSIWVAASLVAVVGMAGLAVDSSYFFVMSNRLQISADSAALAGSNFLDDETALRAEAVKYAQMNLAEDDQILDPTDDILTGNWDHDAPCLHGRRDTLERGQGDDAHVPAERQCGRHLLCQCPRLRRGRHHRFGGCGL